MSAIHFLVYYMQEI